MFPPPDRSLPDAPNGTVPDGSAGRYDETIADERTVVSTPTATQANTAPPTVVGVTPPASRRVLPPSNLAPPAPPRRRRRAWLGLVVGSTLIAVGGAGALAAALALATQIDRGPPDGATPATDLAPRPPVPPGPAADPAAPPEVAAPRPAPPVPARPTTAPSASPTPTPTPTRPAPVPSGTRRPAAPVPSGPTVEDHLAAGWGALRVRPSVAREHFRRVLQEHPRHTDALDGLGRAELALGHPEAALEALCVARRANATRRGAIDATLAGAGLACPP